LVARRNARIRDSPDRGWGQGARRESASRRGAEGLEYGEIIAAVRAYSAKGGCYPVSGIPSPQCLSANSEKTGSVRNPKKGRHRKGKGEPPFKGWE
jgi:hypothetical protein